MADINALIAAGPHTQGIDVAGNMMKVEQLKSMQQRNQLAGLQEDRLQRQDQRASEEQELEQLVMGAQAFVRAWDAGGPDAAEDVMRMFPDYGKLGEAKREYFAAKKTPDPNDELRAVDSARVLASLGGDDQQKRDMRQAADGFWYYTDTQERVFPNVQPKPGSQEPSAKQQEIQSYLMQYPDLSEADATAFAYNKARIEVDDLGVVRFINDLDPSRNRVLNDKTPEMVSLDVPPEQTLYGSSDEATGIWNAGVRTIARITSQVGADTEYAKEELQAKRLVDATLQGTIKALSLNKKYPIAEQKRIEEKLSLSANAWTDPEIFKQETIAMDSWLSREIAKAEREYMTSSNPSVKADARQAANDMRSLLNDLGVPKDKRTDVRAWAMAQEGFFSMTLEQQKRMIELAEMEARLLRGK